MGLRGLCVVGIVYCLNQDFQDWERSIHIPHGWCLECWVSQTLSISVNLRKELVCSRAIHAPLILKEKRHVNCATTNTDILVLCVI